MDISSFVNLLADVTFLVFAGIFVVALGLLFFDRPSRKESAETTLKLVERERRAA